jgi:2-iminobutanoate/2-iminopropanoate deaminase
MKIPLIPEQGAPPQGPYSPGMKATGTMIFVSAQGPLDPATGQIVGETVQEQAERVFENIRLVLEAGGATLADVVRTTVFLKNPEDFAAMNQVYERTFPPPYPARTTVSGVGGRLLVFADAIAVVEG